MMTEKQKNILDMTKDICRVKHNCNDPCNPISACDALKYAERAVEAGYVKVVRCKDCVWWEPHTFGSSIGRCGNPYKGLESTYIDDIDYCSCARMKGAGNE